MKIADKFPKKIAHRSKLWTVAFEIWIRVIRNGIFLVLMHDYLIDMKWNGMSKQLPIDSKIIGLKINRVDTCWKPKGSYEQNS